MKILRAQAETEIFYGIGETDKNEIGDKKF